MAKILPQIGEDALASATARAQADAPYSLFSNPSHVGLGSVVKPYLCPADGRTSRPLTDRDGVTAAYTDFIATAGPRNSVLAG